MTGADVADSGGEAGDGLGEAVLTEEQLREWGRQLGRVVTEPGAEPGVFVGLIGELGAGKTTLVRAACRGAGVEGPVRSPTFTLHNHHRPRGRRPIHHLDLYRLDGPGDLDELGWDHLEGSEGAVFVEWAERAGDRLPGRRWEIRMALAGDPDRRRVETRSLGGAPPVPALPEGDADGEAEGRAALSAEEAGC